jgi:hypothetical protein
MKNLLNFENELIENRNREFNGKKWEGRGWESKNIFFLVWLKYFLLKFFENNHKCVPFGLLITNINLLLLLIYFFYYWPFLDLFWISSPFIWYTKYQLCYLRSHCVIFLRVHLISCTQCWLGVFSTTSAS